MLYQLRDKSDNPILYTGSVTQNGITEVLSSKDFTLIPGKKWTSKKTGIAYPISWTIQIPKRNMDIKTQGLMENSEFDAMLSTYNIYWEGAVKLKVRIQAQASWSYMDMAISKCSLSKPS